MKDNYEKRIEDLIQKMTLEEKVGQLQQCGPSLVGAFEVSFEELLDMMFDGRISQEEFERLMSTAEQDFHEEDLRAGRIGSYNGIGDAATANRLQKIAVEETRLGIPLLFGYDVIHGFRAVTPIPLAESCSWDEKLWERTARMAAEEATSAGVHMTFAPMVDAAKDARWGRVSEGAGEDVLLNALYGAAKVRGFQGEDLTADDAMAACVKHFAAASIVSCTERSNWSIRKRAAIISHLGASWVVSSIAAFMRNSSFSAAERPGVRKLWKREFKRSIPYSSSGKSCWILSRTSWSLGRPGKKIVFLAVIFIYTFRLLSFFVSP